ncbi:MAG: hypothetical protein ACRDRX_01300 [Pseudonocardiaceae bacterium]
MTDGELTQHTQHGTGDGSHCVHLLAAERQLLAECHRQRLCLTLCGEELPTEELASSWCEAECDRLVVYCAGCLRVAGQANAEAGGIVNWSPSGCMVGIR